MCVFVYHDALDIGAYTNHYIDVSILKQRDPG